MTVATAASGSQQGSTAECAQLGYAGTVTGENGFLSVITPSGESNKLACTFTV